MMQSIPDGMKFGALPRTKTCFGDGTFPKHEERFQLIDRKLWQPVSLRGFVPHIYSQVSTMCTANAACLATMTERSFRDRDHNPILSPEYLFGQVAKWGEGSGLDEILQALADDGCCTRDQVPQIDGYLRRSWPENHEALASANRMLEWVDLNADFDAVASALQRRQACVVGVRWPGSREGHAVCVTELILDGKAWSIGGPNSWGPNWNGDGCYRLSERECRDFDQFGCWAVGTST